MKCFRVLAALSLLFLTSCKTNRQLNYMQDAEEQATEAAIANTSAQIQPGDLLAIEVTAQDMEAVIPFNNGTAANYIVQTDNSINFPVIGKISTEHQNIETFTQDLQDRMTKYIFKPTVTVRNMNYKVTVLGEVKSPGTFTLPDGQATVLSALGLAGDLTMYGERNNILIVRNENGKLTKHRFDITRSDFINSPYYYLKQNDVIYVNSNQTVAKQSLRDPNTTIYISVASILITIATTLLFR